MMTMMMTMMIMIMMVTMMMTNQLRVRDGKSRVNEGRAEEPDPEGGHCKRRHRREEGHRHREIYVSCDSYLVDHLLMICSHYGHSNHTNHIKNA